MLSTLSKTIFYVFGHIFCVICKYCQLGPVQNVVTCTGFGYTAFHRLYPQVPIQTDRRENVDNHDDYNSNNDDDMVVLLSMMSMTGIFFFQNVSDTWNVVQCTDIAGKHTRSSPTNFPSELDL